MRYVKWTISYLYFLVHTLTGFSQSYNKYFFRHLDQSDGLLNNIVYSITQDKTGFIWIGTQNGLQRYDGLRFLNYRTELNSPDISRIMVRDIYADSKDHLWMLVNERLEKLEITKNNVSDFNKEQELKDPTFKYDSFRDINNNRWLLGEYGVYFYNSARKNWARDAMFLPDQEKNRSNRLTKDKTTGLTWYASWSGLLIFDPATKRVYTGYDNPMNHPLLDFLGIKRVNPNKYSIRGILLDSYNNIWIYCWPDVFYRYDPTANKINTYSLSAIKHKTIHSGNSDPTLQVNCIFEDNHGRIWIGTGNAGLLEYDREKDNFDFIVDRGENKQSIQYNYEISCIFQDKEDNIWVGTDKGINIFNPYKQYFKVVRNEPGNDKSLPKREINAYIETRQGDILIGTWGSGFTVYDSGLHFIKNISFTGPYEKNLVWSFAEDEDGKIWVGCQHGYIHIYDPVNKTIKSIHPPELEGSTVRCIQNDQNGHLWLGLHNGKIVEWDFWQQKFFSYNNTGPGIPQTFNPVINIFIDNKERYWVSTENGFKQFDPEKKIYTQVYIPETNNPNAISANFSQGIEQYNDSIVLVATLNGGLNYFNSIRKSFSHSAFADDLPSNSVHAIKKDSKSEIWFTSDYRLHKFKPGEGKIVTYHIDNGIINSSFQAYPFFVTRDGRWLTSTLSELICFHPDSLKTQFINKPHVTVTGFSVFNNRLFIDSLLHEGRPVNLSYIQNFVTIEFSNLDFSGLQETKYYYKLSDVDKNWVNAGGKRFANYTNLNPGKYVFQVKAENGYGAGDITSFGIVITPPFWKTSWFRLICLVLAGGVVYTVVIWRIKTVRRQESRKLAFNRQIAEMEMKSLRSQMNPHFIFNCINSIDALIQSNDKYQATVYLNKFAKLIRNILDSSKQNTVSLGKDIETLQLYIDLEKFRNENKFNSEINVEEALLQEDYKVPPLIIQPFVENAILHGLRNRRDNNGRLNITITRNNNHIKYIIEDNGVGRAATGNGLQKEKQSYGVQMSKDRVKIFNQEDRASVEIMDLNNDGQAAGTKVQVLLKIQ